MSALVSRHTSPRGPRGAPRVGGSDREFLPAALEILETPASPVRLALIALICGFVVAALAWSYCSRIDIVAVAQGKLQPTGRTKVVQPLETGRVVEIAVENGAEVKAGQVLLELDPAEATAEAGQLADDLAAYRAEATRRGAAIAAARGRRLEPPPAIAWAEAIPAQVRQREDHVLAADMAQLSAQVAGLDAQIAQKAAEAERLTRMIVAETVLIATMQQRVAMREALMATNAGSKSSLIDALEALQTQQTTLVQQKGQLEEAKAGALVFGHDINRAYRSFVADNAQKLAEAERQAGDLGERLAKAEAHLDHLTLRSPTAGTVTASIVTGPGQVLTSGQDAMRIVSNHDALEVECYLPNRDIGFVKPGDKAVLKIESFPFTRYGTIEAIVTKVAHDAIPQPDADQIEQDGTRKPQAQSTMGGQRMQNLVFAVTLRPERKTIDVDGTHVPLGPGMAVTAEIRTGSRRILEYVFSPLVKVASQAMRER